VDNANELRMIGPRGWTLVKPMRAKTMTYKQAVHETDVNVSLDGCGRLPVWTIGGHSLKNMRIPKRSKKAPMIGMSTIGTTLCKDELYPAARAEVPLV
jgi:hypothetical protein